MLRVLVGLLVGAVCSAVGALMLGEYTFGPAAGLGVGVIFGLVVAEVVVALGGRRSLVVAIATAAIVAAGLLWAGWIVSGEGLRPMPTSAWIAAAAGVVVAGWRAGEWRRPTHARSASEQASSP